MGTDIHLCVERRVKNKWKIQIPPEPPPAAERTDADGYVNPWWGPYGCMYVSKCYGADRDTCKGATCKACLGTGRDLRWYNTRNYHVFAILTGTVRNGYGFAGVPTSTGFTGVTKKPRGLPKDCDAPTKYNVGEHSHSWLALPKILAFDWDQVTTHVDVIPMRKEDDALGDHSHYVDWRKKRKRKAPDSYSGGVTGADIETITEDKAKYLLRYPTKIARGTRYRVQVTWTEAYRESAADFLAFIDTFVKPLGDPKDTRLVFGFDS
jgi:hypothetical protein